MRLTDEEQAMRAGAFGPATQWAIDHQIRVGTYLGAADFVPVTQAHIMADTGIRVNCVTPAAVRTPLFAQMSQTHIDYMLSKIPLGRFGEPQEIAALVAWLASEDCSFSTGAVFDLSGGRATY